MSEQADTRKWSWWAVEVDGPEDNPETYYLNEPTREGVILAAQREFPGSWVAIVEATQDGPFKTRPFAEQSDCDRVDTVMDWFLDDNGARWGEDSGPPMLALDCLAVMLNNAFEAFITANHCHVLEAAWSFTATRNAESLFMGPGN